MTNVVIEIVAVCAECNVEPETANCSTDITRYGVSVETCQIDIPKHVIFLFLDIIVSVFFLT
jgi:hypothetical protein